AESIHQVRATADKSWAAAQNSLQAKYDMKKGEASATWTSLVKIHYDGVSYDAGMVIGAELKNGKVSTQIGFSAQTFIVYNPANGKMEPVFAIKNGQVVMSSVFIGDGTITNAKIKNGAITRAKIVESLESDNYEKDKKGIKIDFANGIMEMNSYEEGQGRMVINNNKIDVFDGSGALRVRIGKL
ncbi:MAG TPA: DUF1983 domain-containing protein, partial [Arsenophonus apicola]